MIIKTLPTLYKRTSNGSIEMWSISVQVPDGTVYGALCYSHGLVGGKQQSGQDVITEGKNAGKANATTAIAQAVAEATAKWRKQIERNGYVEDIERARAGKTDAEGGIAVMLAKEEKEGLPRIVWPARAQRKYNGNRCVMIREADGSVSLWSRKRKRITGFPHIEQAYSRELAGWTGRLVLDGELYRHGWSLQKISGFCRSKTPKSGHEGFSHFVYDIPSCDGPWSERELTLATLFATRFPTTGPIELVQTFGVSSYEETKALQRGFVAEGYEGAILRNTAGLYRGVRSFDLVKVKDFIDAEFKIVGVTDGRGKFAGKAVFQCVTDEGNQFDCSAPGRMEDRAAFLADAPNLVGKMLTVRFFEWSDDKIPLQGRGIVVRDYE